MSNPNDCEIENIDAREIPIFSGQALPAKSYIPFVVEKIDPSCRDTMLALYHLPISRLTPGGTFQQNSYSIPGNGFITAVPDGEVIPAYTRATIPHDIRRANAGNVATLAKYLVVASDSNLDGNYIIQANGPFTFTSGHGYAIGQQYYLSNTDGGVSTIAGTNSQKLFYVLDATTILIGVE